MPILMLFQEVLGCSTCVNYGEQVLSDPLMVEMIENEFIPLAIHNNSPGKGAPILKQYNELAWNNPVTYFIDENGNSIIPKMVNHYDSLSLYNRTLEVFQRTERAIPPYFVLYGSD